MAAAPEIVFAALSNTPQEVGGASTFVETLEVHNPDAANVVIKLFDSASSPDLAAEAGDRRAVIVAGDARPVFVGRRFARGCWIVATTEFGAGSTAPGTAARVVVAKR